MITRTRLIALVASATLICVFGVWLALSEGAVAHKPQRAGDPRRVGDQQVIDANTDPAAAGKALDDFCQKIANCKFVGSSPITTGYSAARILGDTLYNCGQAYAEDAVAISDQRSESTSLEESLSAEVSGGFLGLEKTSIDAEVNSKQLEEVSTTTTDENSVAIPPGWEGWTQTRVSQASVTGDVTVTDGIHLITVNNLTLDYPGLATPGDAGVNYAGVRTAMTDADLHDRCGTLPKPPALGGGLRALPPAHFPIVLCTRASNNSSPAFAVGASRKPSPTRCATRMVTGAVPPTAATRAQATLTRGRLTFAAGTAHKNRIVLNARRKVRAGAYTLTITAPHLVTTVAVAVR